MLLPQRRQDLHSRIDSLVYRQAGDGQEPSAALESISGAYVAGIDSRAEVQWVGSERNRANLGIGGAESDLLQHLETECPGPRADGGQHGGVAKRELGRNALAWRPVDPISQQEQLGPVQDDSVRNPLAPTKPQRRKTSGLEIAAPDETRLKGAGETLDPVRPDQETLDGTQPCTPDACAVYDVGQRGVHRLASRHPPGRDEQRPCRKTLGQLTGQARNAAANRRKVIAQEELTHEIRG